MSLNDSKGYAKPLKATKKLKSIAFNIETIKNIINDPKRLKWIDPLPTFWKTYRLKSIKINILS